MNLREFWVNKGNPDRELGFSDRVLHFRPLEGLREVVFLGIWGRDMSEPVLKKAASMSRPSLYVPCPHETQKGNDFQEERTGDWREDRHRDKKIRWLREEEMGF